jgi:hypothetical protein
MKFLMLFLLPVALAVPSEAARYQAFCWAQLSSGVYCTKIARSLSYSIQGFACRQYALALGASSSGFFRDTDSARLRQKQEEGCNYVAQQPKWQCFVETRCETSDGVTSSLAPIGRAVFSPVGDSEAARVACVSDFGPIYLESLKGASNSCLVGARAVMTVP